MSSAPYPNPAVSGTSPNPCSSTPSVILTARTASIQFTGELTRSKTPASAGLFKNSKHRHIELKPFRSVISGWFLEALKIPLIFYIISGTLTNRIHRCTSLVFEPRSRHMDGYSGKKSDKLANNRINWQIMLLAKGTQRGYNKKNSRIKEVCYFAGSARKGRRIIMKTIAHIIVGVNANWRIGCRFSDGDRRRAFWQKSQTLLCNVIQIRMTERELELKKVPVSFFVKKFAKKGWQISQKVRPLSLLK